MRAVGIGLLGVGLLASLWADSPCQAAGPSSLGIAVVQTTVGHPPGPPGPGRYWRHPPVPRPPCVVLPPPPPPPPPPDGSITCIHRPCIIIRTHLITPMSIPLSTPVPMKPCIILLPVLGL
jgi:hypothetical protein